MPEQRAPRGRQSKSTVNRASSPQPRSSPKTATSKRSRKPDTEAVFIARAAIALCRLPPGTEPMFTVPAARKLSRQVAQEFRKGLDSDWRVSEVLPEGPDRDLDNARTSSFIEISPEAVALTDAIAPFEALAFNSPIMFRISVLAKNQPKYRNMDDVPTDDYLVIWDGIEVVVQWEQSSPRATGSGGHIVFDLLKEVGKSLGYPVEILACSSSCHHKFVHGDFVTFADIGHGDEFHIHGETPVASTIHTPYSKDVPDIENIRRTFASTAGLIHTFAQAKSLLDALGYLDWRARHDSNELLSMAYENASRRRLPHVAGWLADLWRQLRSSRRRRELIASEWLALTSIDTYRATWRARNAEFHQFASNPRVSQITHLFDTGQDAVEAQDMTVVRSALQESSTRADAGRLLIATAAAAVAAVVASLITVWLTA